MALDFTRKPQRARDRQVAPRTAGFKTTMPRKRKTKEEVREKTKIARRKRYEHIKSNAVLYALEKEKKRQKYTRQKEQYSVQ
ncbi:unnamed protein product, partial [Brenthis ino]